MFRLGGSVAQVTRCLKDPDKYNTRYRYTCVCSIQVVVVVKFSLWANPLLENMLIFDSSSKSKYDSV